MWTPAIQCNTPAIGELQSRVCDVHFPFKAASDLQNKNVCSAISCQKFQPLISPHNNNTEHHKASPPQLHYTSASRRCKYFFVQLLLPVKLPCNEAPKKKKKRLSPSPPTGSPVSLQHSALSGLPSRLEEFNREGRPVQSRLEAEGCSESSSSFTHRCCRKA